jgi:hypothetical protein
LFVCREDFPQQAKTRLGSAMPADKRRELTLAIGKVDRKPW